MERNTLLYFLKRVGVSVDSEKSTDTKIIASCPFAPFFHKRSKDSKPSFAAFAQEDGISGFVCKACHTKGSIFKLIQMLGHLRNKDYSDLNEECIKAEYDREVSFSDFEDNNTNTESIEPLNEDLYFNLYDKATQHSEALTYLSKRNISACTADRLNILYDEEDRRVLFEVRDGCGNLHGYTGRSIDKNPKLKVKDYFGLPKKHLILGEDLWERDKPVLVVEGLFGYAHLHNIGIADLVNIGALLGSELTEQKADILKNRGDDVYLLLDNDNAGDIGIYGHEGKKGALHKLKGAVAVFIPAWPDGKEDPDELSMEEVEYMIKNTYPE